LMARLRPTSTLLPYTTLFRSRDRGGGWIRGISARNALAGSADRSGRPRALRVEAGALAVTDRRRLRRIVALKDVRAHLLIPPYQLRHHISTREVRLERAARACAPAAGHVGVAVTYACDVGRDQQGYRVVRAVDIDCGTDRDAVADLDHVDRRQGRGVRRCGTCTSEPTFDTRAIEVPVDDQSVGADHAVQRGVRIAVDVALIRARDSTKSHEIEVRVA